MIEITIGMHDPDGGLELPFTGCFLNRYRNRYPNGYRNPSGKQEQDWVLGTVSGTVRGTVTGTVTGTGDKPYARSRRKKRLLRATEQKEVA